MTLTSKMICSKKKEIDWTSIKLIKKLKKTKRMSLSKGSLKSNSKTIRAAVSHLNRLIKILLKMNRKY